MKPKPKPAGKYKRLAVESVKPKEGLPVSRAKVRLKTNDLVPGKTQQALATLEPKVTVPASRTGRGLKPKDTMSGQNTGRARENVKPIV